MDPRRAFGNKGEAEAERYLKKKGYQILERQFLTRFGEIDLIVRHEREIVFVEVKTRTTSAHGFPEEGVTAAKLRRLEIAAEAYLKQKAWEEQPHRFDVIAILTSGSHSEIEHLIGV